MGFMREWDKNKKDWEPKLKKIQQLAKEKLNCTLAQLSIAWIIQNKDISTVFTAYNAHNFFDYCVET